MKNKKQHFSHKRKKDSIIQMLTFLVKNAKKNNKEKADRKAFMEAFNNAPIGENGRVKL